MASANTTEAVKPRVALVQDGARGHYGLALALKEAGILEVMYTDFFIQRGDLWDRLSPLLRRIGKGQMLRMLDRRCAQLDGAQVRTKLRRRFQQMRQRNKFANVAAFLCWQARDNGTWISRDLDSAANILMGFIRSTDPELCRRAREMGIITVGDQPIAPGKVEQREYRRHQELFPGWEPFFESELDEFISFEEETWRELDAITCPSEYVAEGLVSEGVERERVHVVEYPIDEVAFVSVDRAGRKGPVRVGFVGQVGLRKGTPYFVEMAKRFPRAQVEFVMLGHSILTEEALAQRAQQHVHIVSATRSQVPAMLASFDLIYFPTTCEGSAYALMEAMAMGLPVVTSPNSGTVARHGIEGFLYAYDDLDGAYGSIEKLVRDPALRLQMGRAASERYRQFGSRNYSAKLSALCTKLVQERGAKKVSSEAAI